MPPPHDQPSLPVTRPAVDIYVWVLEEQLHYEDVAALRRQVHRCPPVLPLDVHLDKGDAFENLADILQLCFLTTKLPFVKQMDNIFKTNHMKIFSNIPFK